MRSDAKSLIEFFLKLKKKFGLYVPRKRFSKELEHNTRMIDDWSLRQVERNIVATAENNNISSIVATQQVKTASGIKTALRNVNIESGSITEAVIKNSIKTNVDLISKLDQEYKNKVEKILHEGFASSRSRKEMAEEIAKTTGVQLKKAEFWVRDQAGKFYSDVSRKRIENAGFEGYIWRTKKDSRVRDSHRHLEGEYCRWDDPPPVKDKNGNIRYLHPGEDYRCRCWAEAALPPKGYSGEKKDPWGMPIVSYSQEQNTKISRLNYTKNNLIKNINDIDKGVRNSAETKYLFVYGDTVNTGLDKIGKVHTMPKGTKKARIREKSFGRGSKVGGEFKAEIDTKTKEFRKQEITLNKDLHDGSPKNILTIFHEWGHHIDFSVFGKEGNYGNGGKMKEVMRKIKGTKTFEKLEYKSENMSLKRISERENLRVIKSSLKNEELFARAYTQYITEKLNDKDLLDYLYSIDIYWTKDEFIPIKQVMDKLFLAKGMLE